MSEQPHPMFEEFKQRALQDPETRRVYEKAMNSGPPPFLRFSCWVGGHRPLGAPIREGEVMPCRCGKRKLRAEMKDCGPVYSRYGSPLFNNDVTREDWRLVWVPL